MPRLDIPKRFVTAVYLNVIIDGERMFQREPYNIVALDYGDGTSIQTYIEPNCGIIRSPQERTIERYEEIRTYDSPPFPKSRIGYAGPGQ
jgi:hypothetical protein